MKTEILNEYIFTDLIMKLAYAKRQKRQRQMMDDGITRAEAEKIPLSQEDKSQAILQIESERKEILALRSELCPDPLE